MRLLKKFLLIFFTSMFSLSLLYADIIYSFPEQITMYSGQKHSKDIGIGVRLGKLSGIECVETSDNIVPLKDGEYASTLNVAGKIPFKKVTIKVTEQKDLFASGDLIGMRIFNKGLIVTEIKRFVTDTGERLSPAEASGIFAGDVIIKINKALPETSEAVSSLLKEGKNTIEIIRDSKRQNITITPLRDENDNQLKLGVMVRDSTAGVGTITYYDNEKLCYGALGHGISETDTGILFDVQKGAIEKSSVLSLKKSERGAPGEISGSFSEVQEMIGTVEKNCEEGIFGKLLDNHTLSGKEYPLGLMSQAKLGNAQILSTVDDTIKFYDVKILRTLPFGSASKGIMLEITDPTLLEKAGGIVQGMSGSPIIQDGKLIGAVTHVLVNDPTRGYGIFIENMLNSAE